MESSIDWIGFGMFPVSECTPYIGVNPKTKANKKITASRKEKFKGRSKFKEMVIGKKCSTVSLDVKFLSRKLFIHFSRYL